MFTKFWCKKLFFFLCDLIIHASEGSVSSALAFRWPLAFSFHRVFKVTYDIVVLLKMYIWQKYRMIFGVGGAEIFKWGCVAEKNIMQTQLFKNIPVNLMKVSSLTWNEGNHFVH